ncbi:hypothetical protein M5361_13360 [Ligilactobacillus agilis]|nr:hypothetical protein [Ligilactobacillus agilis]
MPPRLLDYEHPISGRPRKIRYWWGISAQPLVIKGINQAYDDLYHTNEAVTLTLCRPQITVAKFNNDANLYGALYQLLLTTAPKIH